MQPRTVEYLPGAKLYCLVNRCTRDERKCIQSISVNRRSSPEPFALLTDFFASLLICLNFKMKYVSDSSLVEESSIKDLSWIVLLIHDDNGETIPVWTGFNQQTEDSNNIDICNTGYLALINSPEHE